MKILVKVITPSAVQTTAFDNPILAQRAARYAESQGFHAEVIA